MRGGTIGRTLPGREETTHVAIAVRTELLVLNQKEAFRDAVPAHFERDAEGQARTNEVLVRLASLPNP